MTTRSLDLITDIWNNRDKSIIKFNIYSNIFIDTYIVKAVYIVLLEVQKHKTSIDLEYMIYIINKNHLLLEGDSDNYDYFSFINFPPLKQMLIEGINLGDKLPLDLRLFEGYFEMCKIVENQ
jgi:hypothetical protein